MAVFIHGLVDVPPTAGDLEIGLIDLPSRPDRVPGAVGSLDQDRDEPPDPPMDGDVVDLHAAFGQ